MRLQWAAALAVAAALCAACGVSSVGPMSSAPSAASVDHDAGPTVTMTWSRTYPGVTAQSSPAPVTIDGRAAVVVGTRAGQLQAFWLADGDTVPGWPVTTPGRRPVDSTPSIDGDLVLVGTGDAASPTGGGYLAVRDNGTVAWYTQVSKVPGATTPYAGVSASVAVGALAGPGLSAVAGSLGQQEDELDARTGTVRPGFPWFSSDTEFSTPAIADLYGNGRNEIIEGAEQTAGTAYGHQYSQGGNLRVLSAEGNAGAGQPGGGVVCDDTPDQGVYSSPAVGRFLAGGAVGIVAGTSTNFPDASDTDKLLAIDSHCRPVWTASLDGSTQSSPSLVDALGNGRLQITEGTNEGTDRGTVYLLDGVTGRILWQQNLAGAIIGGIDSADLGGGHQDLIVATTGGAYILDGRTGAVMDQLAGGRFGEQNSPLVTDDADGSLGITLAGYNPKGGSIAHFEVAGTDGRRYDEAGAWPEFHLNPQLTGSTLPPVGSSAPGPPAT